VVGRYRGKEFGIILPRCSLRKGQQMAEEIRRAIGLAKWESKVASAPTFINTTASIGIAERRDGEGPAELLRRAEACLDVARRRGRDTVAA
jgi:diguanylate cyclase (GGDEF)-like protein